MSNKRLPAELSDMILARMKENATSAREGAIDYLNFAESILPPAEAIAWVADNDFKVAVRLMTLGKGSTGSEGVAQIDKGIDSPHLELAELVRDLIRTSYEFTSPDHVGSKGKGRYKNMVAFLEQLPSLLNRLELPREKAQVLIFFSAMVDWVALRASEKEKAFSIFSEGFQSLPVENRLQVLSSLPHGSWWLGRSWVLDENLTKKLLSLMEETFMHPEITARQKVQLLACLFDYKELDTKNENTPPASIFLKCRELLTNSGPSDEWFGRAKQAIQENQRFLSEKIQLTTGLLRHETHLAQDEQKAVAEIPVQTLFEEVERSGDSAQKKLISKILPLMAKKLSAFQRGSAERSDHQCLLKKCFAIYGAAFDEDAAKLMLRHSGLGNFSQLGATYHQEIINAMEPAQLKIMASFAERKHDLSVVRPYLVEIDGVTMGPTSGLITIRLKSLEDPSWRGGDWAASAIHSDYPF